MTPAEIRFAADGMLRSLGTWLRLLGYDCLDDRAESGRRLLARAAAEGRVFLTRNAHLTDTLPRALLDQARIATVAAEHLPEQLREIVARFQLETGRLTFSRCLHCNTLLEPCPPVAVAGRVPPEVAARESAFWSCPACGQVFWHGSHVRNSRARLERWLGEG